MRKSTEPDIFIKSRPLTPQKEKMISEYIRKRKEELKGIEVKKGKSE